MNKFSELLERQGPVILDGGLATQLEAMGYDISSTLWSASLLASNPRAIVDAHRAYLDAGADIIVTASYQASREGFMSHGIAPDDADQLILSSVELAQAARDEFLADNPDVAAAPLIAASVGPYGAARHDGSEYTGDYDASDETLGRFHTERLQILDQSGADLLAVETIPNFREAQVLRRLLENAATPSWVAFACRDDRNLSDGSRLWAAAGLFADHPRVLALGINCTPPQFVLPLIGELRAAAPDKPMVVYPNSGETYHVEDNSWSGTACDFGREFAVDAWCEAGAKIVGGCCRTGPADIAEIRSRLLA
jgi:homocysteine S-methyltransferase